MVEKDQYLSAMERSPVNDLDIKCLLQKALTSKINDRQLFMKSVDYSYDYEGYNQYKLEEIIEK